MKKIVLLVAVALISLTGVAQKFGHINSQELLQMMPETKAAEKEIEKIQKEHQAVLEQLQAEYQKIATELQSNPNLPEAIYNSKLQQAQGLEQNMYDQQQTAQNDLLAKQESLLAPIIEKAKMAIESIGTENGFTYIFDTSTGAVVYEGGEDIMTMAKAKLGITE